MIERSNNLYGYEKFDIFRRFVVLKFVSAVIMHASVHAYIGLPPLPPTFYLPTGTGRPTQLLTLPT